MENVFGGVVRFLYVGAGLAGLTLGIIALVSFKRWVWDNPKFLTTIRFRRHFGMWPPRDQVGSNIVKVVVDAMLTDLADGCKVLFDQQEGLQRKYHPYNSTKVFASDARLDFRDKTHLERKIARQKRHFWYIWGICLRLKLDVREEIGKYYSTPSRG